MPRKPLHPALVAVIADGECDEPDALRVFEDPFAG